MHLLSDRSEATFAQDLKLEIDRLTKNEAHLRRTLPRPRSGTRPRRPDGRHYTTQMAFNTRARPVQKSRCTFLALEQRRGTRWHPRGRLSRTLPSVRFAEGMAGIEARPQLRR